MDFLQIVKSIGDSLGWAVQQTLIFLSNLGIKTNLIASKIILLIFSVGIIYLFLSVLSYVKPAVKWILVILFVLLGASVIVSFFV